MQTNPDFIEVTSNPDVKWSVEVYNDADDASTLVQVEYFKTFEEADEAYMEYEDAGYECVFVYDDPLED